VFTVDAGLRGKGLGRAITSFLVYEALRTFGTASLLADEDNIPAVHLYRSIGMRSIPLLAARVRGKPSECVTTCSRGESIMRLFRRHPATLFLLSSAVVLSLTAGCATTQASNSASGADHASPRAESGAVRHHHGSARYCRSPARTRPWARTRSAESSWRSRRSTPVTAVLGQKLAVAVEDSQGQTTATIDAARKLVAVSKGARW